MRFQASHQTDAAGHKRSERQPASARSVASILWLLTLFVTPKYLPCSLASDVGAPNVLMICIDDLNDWTGFLDGHPEVRTPHMDSLARRGVSFSNAHCAVPVCSSSRISVMSGVAATTHGSYEIGPRYEDLEPLSTVPTIHRFFKDHGYYTLTGGKVLHHDFRGRLSADIDRNLGRNKSPRPGKPLNRPGHWSAAWDWGAYPETNEEMADFQLASMVANVFSESFDQPFFLSVGFFRPHVPLYVPPQWFRLYDEQSLSLPANPLTDLSDVPPNFLTINDYALAPTHREVLASNKHRSLTQAYLASISFTDHCVGIVTAALGQSQYADETIVVLWSDHGFHLGEKQHWAKRTLWEESTRVPLLFAGPGIQPHGECKEAVSLIDIFPTLTSLCGLPENPHLEGVSLRPQILNPETKRETPAITSSYYGNHSIRSRDWRLIVYNDGQEELYDHRNDPDEFKNLAGQPEASAAREELIRWLPAQEAPEFKSRSERLRKRK